MLEFGAWSPGAIILLVCVVYWGVRLTANWAYTFRGYAHQDWRYTCCGKERRVYPPVSLFGIMLFPTLVVYLCLLPALRYVQRRGQRGHRAGFCAVSFGGDAAARCGRSAASLSGARKSRGELIRTGVWRHARHPNYLGEILMWWGVYVVMLSVLPRLWPLGLGALVKHADVPVHQHPMAETRLAQYKEGFSDYAAQTNRLLPLRWAGRGDEENLIRGVTSYGETIV
jgi:steroid 5-alpha reductase family enzyme